MPGRTIWKWCSRLVIIPAELLSEAGMPGNCAMTDWNSASWVRFFSCCGWSAQARWLITICGS